MSKTKCYFDNELSAVVLEINGFIAYDDFKLVASETHQLRRKHFVKTQLNNIKNMKVLTGEIQNWIDSDWFPEAKRTGLKHFAFVVPEDTFGKVSMETVNKNASEKYGMEIEYFCDEKNAKEWLGSKS